MPDCIFCKIIRGEMKAEIVYEDEHVLAFRDINPQAPTHLLIIPREHITSINHLENDHESTVGKLFLSAKALAAQEGIEESGYRVVMNCGEGAGQTVFHIHLHLLGGRRMGWPPG